MIKPNYFHLNLTLPTSFYTFPSRLVSRICCHIRMTPYDWQEWHLLSPVFIKCIDYRTLAGKNPAMQVSYSRVSWCYKLAIDNLPIHDWFRVRLDYEGKGRGNMWFRLPPSSYFSPPPSPPSISPSLPLQLNSNMAVIIYWALACQYHSCSAD